MEELHQNEKLKPFNQHKKSKGKNLDKNANAPRVTVRESKRSKTICQNPTQERLMLAAACLNEAT
jgi:hypothetical protein